jgi:hypothetical protein
VFVPRRSRYFFGGGKRTRRDVNIITPTVDKVGLDGELSAILVEETQWATELAALRAAVLSN